MLQTPTNAATIAILAVAKRNIESRGNIITIFKDVFLSLPLFLSICTATPMAAASMLHDAGARRGEISLGDLCPKKKSMMKW